MNKFFVSLAILAVSACGFNLKGSGLSHDQLPYQAWLVDGGELQQPLETALLRTKARPVDAQQAQAIVTVNKIDAQKDILTITRAAKINEYLLILTVEAEASIGGKVLGEPMRITIQRPMDYADSEVLGKQEEEAMIWQEMRRDAAEQIVQRLSFIKANP